MTWFHIDNEVEDDNDDEDMTDIHSFSASGLHGDVSTMSNNVATCGGSFNLNYDQETPLRRIDIGGNDQAVRSASLC